MMEKKQHYTTGWKGEREAAYSRAIRVGPLIFISGTTGFDYAANHLPDDALTQTIRAFGNISTALQELGGKLSDLVQLTTYYTRQEDWPLIQSALSEVLSDIRPTNSAILAGLVSEAMKVEISAIAALDEG